MGYGLYIYFEEHYGIYIHFWKQNTSIPLPLENDKIALLFGTLPNKEVSPDNYENMN